MSLGDTEEITGGRQSFKLTQRGGDRFADAASEPGIAQSLPRADGGKDAWLFLMGGFMIESLVWGFPFSFGVFEKYYSTHDAFSKDTSSGIAAIGTTSTGIMYLSGPFTFFLLQRYPRFRRPSAVIGFFLIAISIVLASFAQSVTHLLLTQGILYAIGGSLVYSPTIFYLDEWFIQRKGLAFGVMWAGTGAAGLILPFVMSWLLSSYGFRTTLRVWAITFCILAGPFIYYVKPRIPVSKSSGPQKISFDFVGTKLFWMLQIGNIIEGLGFFIPSIYLPTYASSLGLPEIMGTISISLLNSTSVFGSIMIGLLVDRLHITTVMLISSLGAAVSVILLWGLATSNPVLCIFSIMYGIFAGGFSACWAGIIKAIRVQNPEADSSTIFGLIAAGRGIGAVASGPLSVSMISGTGSNAFGGYGTGYMTVIIFTGVTALFGGVSWVGRKAKMI